MACTNISHKDNSTAQSAQQRARVAEFVRSGWNFELGNTMDEIKQSLGKPLSDDVKPIRNPHVGGQVDEIHNLDYGGLVVSVYRANEKPPRDLAFRLIITDKRFPLKWGLRIGSRRADVIRIFGQPDKVGDHIRYSSVDIEAGDDNSVTFSLSSGQIEKVEWEWYLDGAYWLATSKRT